MSFVDDMKRNQPKVSYAIDLRGFGNEGVFEDYFETYTHLSPGLTPWTMYDGDNTATRSLFAGAGQEMIPTYTGAFIGLDGNGYPYETGTNWLAHSGDKYLGCASAQGAQNNDWLVSPQLSFADNPRISFFAKSLEADFNPESFNVLFSTTGNSDSDFAGNYLNITQPQTVNLDWTLFEYELPASCANTDVYIAIQCVSNGKAMLMVDDFVAVDEGGTPPLVPVELSSFTAVLTADQYVKLQWTTQSETGVSGFYVYRASTSILTNAIMVSPLIGATNTGDLHDYEYVDADLYDSGSYYYWLSVHNMDGSEDYHGPIAVNYNPGDDPATPEIPLVSGFSSIYPNPFNPSTTIAYGLSQNAELSFVIYNARGQVVRRISEGQKTAGNWKLIWNGLDENGSNCPTGIYHIRMNAGKESFVKKIALLK